MTSGILRCPLITSYFSRVPPSAPSQKRKRTDQDNDLASQDLSSKKIKRSSGEEVNLQEMSIHRILISKVCSETGSLDFKSVIQRIVSIYNGKKKGHPYKEIHHLDCENVESCSFKLSAFSQSVPIKSRIFTYLRDLGGANLSTAQKVTYVFFFYRSQASSESTLNQLFAVTTGDGWRVVRQFSDYSFPKSIARRLLDPDKISIMHERFLVGDKLSHESIARNFSVQERPLDSFIITMRCRLRDNASLFALDYFQEKGKKTPLQTNIKIGIGTVRICKQLPLPSYSFILDHFSKIIHHQQTFCYSSKPGSQEKESEATGFDFLDYFVPVDRLLTKELEKDLQEVVWSSFESQEDLPLDFWHKYSSDYAKSSSFSLEYTKDGKAFSYEWCTVKSGTEMLDLLRRIPPLASASRDEFLRDLKKVTISFDNSGTQEKAPFMDFLGGLVRDKKGAPFWRLNKRWYLVSVDYLGCIQRQFEELVGKCFLNKKFLPEEWPSPDTVEALKKANTENRNYTEAIYNEQYLGKDGWILGDRICAAGIELFDLLHYTSTKLYLIHVKHGFDGTSTRVACSQIRNSANFVNDALNRQNKDKNKLELFYDETINPSPSKKEDEVYRQRAKKWLLEKFPQKSDFVQKFTHYKERITFVYAFADKAVHSRPLKTETDLKKSIASSYPKDHQKILKSLEKDGFIDSEGFLTDLSQSISQKKFIKKFSYKSQNFRKGVYRVLDKHRSLSKTSGSTIARMELLHTQKQLAGLGFDFKICQITRENEDSELLQTFSSTQEANVGDNLEDVPLSPLLSVPVSSTLTDESDSDSDSDAYDSDQEGISESVENSEDISHDPMSPFPGASQLTTDSSGTQGQAMQIEDDNSDNNGGSSALNPPPPASSQSLTDPSGVQGQSMQIEDGDGNKDSDLNFSSSSFSGSSQQTAPLFIQGQPVQLKNDGSSCFINAPFQWIMSMEEIRKAVLETCQEWMRQYKVFERLMKWIANSSSTECLTKEDLLLLFPFVSTSDFGNQGYEDSIRSKIGSSAINSEPFKCFDKQVKEFREARAQVKPYPQLSDELLDQMISLFDHQNFISGAFKQPIEEELASKAKGVDGVIGNAKKYQEACSVQKHHTDTPLTDLRFLLPYGQREGQQDGPTWLRALLNLINKRKYPQFFYNLAIEQQFVPYQPVADGERGVKQAKRLEEHISKGNPADSLPSGNKKLQRPELNYEIQISIPPNLLGQAEGQDLIDQYCQFHDKDNDPIIYRNPDTQKPELYKIHKERAILTGAPDFIIVTLERFDSQGKKIDSVVKMPRTINIGGLNNNYQLSAILQHRGGFNQGHYFSLVNKERTWWMCDDGHDFISQATEAQVSQAMEYGYSYFYTKHIPS